MKDASKDSRGGGGGVREERLRAASNVSAIIHTEAPSRPCLPACVLLGHDRWG